MRGTYSLTRPHFWHCNKTVQARESRDTRCMSWSASLAQRLRWTFLSFGSSEWRVFFIVTKKAGSSRFPQTVVQRFLSLASEVFFDKDKYSNQEHPPNKRKGKKTKRKCRPSTIAHDAQPLSAAPPNTRLALAATWPLLLHVLDASSIGSYPQPPA
jgi:hypothetical protein